MVKVHEYSFQNKKKKVHEYVHHTRFQALYEVPKSPILFNDFLVSLTDLEALSVVLLLCAIILNDDEENDTLIYTYI